MPPTAVDLAVDVKGPRPIGCEGDHHRLTLITPNNEAMWYELHAESLPPQLLFGLFLEFCCSSPPSALLLAILKIDANLHEPLAMHSATRGFIAAPIYYFSIGNINIETNIRNNTQIYI